MFLGFGEAPRPGIYYRFLLVPLPLWSFRTESRAGNLAAVREVCLPTLGKTTDGAGFAGYMVSARILPIPGMLRSFGL